MILMMKVELVKPTKWHIALLFVASISTAVSGTILVAAYTNLTAPTVDKNPIVYKFGYSEPYERPQEFTVKLYS